jgi:kinesin family protein 5
MSVIKEGAAQRTTASTNLNNTSSRSHAVLTITLTQKLQDGSELTSKMHLVDLAGSENVGRSEVTGTTLAETQAINKSLSCLGNVIFALTEKGREHIPYRDSKLTFLLQDSLGGNSKTCIVCTATPSVTCYSETVNTLKFAKRAKEIRNIPKLNRSDSPVNLQRIIEQLQKRISELELERVKKTLKFPLQVRMMI